MHPSIKLFITGLCLVILAGCGVTKPSRFYILTPVEDSSAATIITPGPALGVGPVTFPAYLERPEIAHRSGDNQLHYAASHRWAEPLKTTFIRTLAENLTVILPTDRTSIHPWPRSARLDYQVTVKVLRFDADAGGTVVLVSGWEVIRTEDGVVVERNRTTYTETAGTFDYPAIVAAQSRAVQQLSRDIAVTLRRTGE
ncbi:MAG: PqiC family protein [Desulfobulbia bacterium]